MTPENLHHTQLQAFALSSVGSISTREAMLQHFSALSDKQLRELLTHLKLPLPPRAVMSGETITSARQFMLEKLVAKYERRKSQINELNDLPLFPDEKLLWDEDLIPIGQYDGRGVLAMPKLNLQFLTVHDYLLRSFNLFRLESSYQVLCLVHTSRR